MKLKSNYLLQVSMFIIMLFIYIGIFIFLFSQDLDKESRVEFYKGSISLLVIPIVIFIVNIVINFIINLFIIPKLYIYEDEFIYKNEIYKYSDITKIKYNVGRISKTNSEIAAMILYLKSRAEIKINNPSIKMIINMKKKCKNKPFILENWKFYLWFSIILFIVIIFIKLTGAVK